MDTLSELIKEKRAQKNLTQHSLSVSLNTTPNTVQSLESGHANCSHKMLAKLYQVLQPDAPFSVWALASLERTLTRQEDVDPNLKQELRDDIQKCIQELTPRRAGIGQPVRSLAQFPEGFEPLTVVAGGRREEPPITRGDLLAGSASPDDLRYLLSLGLAVPGSIVRTDKLIVNTASDEELNRVFGGSNLLVVGSPFVNFVSRVLNNYSVFRFEPLVFIRTWQEKLSKIRKVGGSELKQFDRISCGQQSDPIAGASESQNDQRDLQELAENLRGEGATQTLKELYRPTMLIDPVRLTTYPANLGVNVSHGIIALMPNPFDSSGKYFAILVAGVHLASTIAAVKTLAEADFTEHPLGGIIEVVDPMGLEDPWCNWKTPKYSISCLAGNLESAIDSEPAKRSRIFKDWSRRELTHCLDFCRLVA